MELRSLESLSTEAACLIAVTPKSRGAVRFPICLPVNVAADGRSFEGWTKNISTSGILFHIDELLSPGAEVSFFVALPADVIGSGQMAAVHGSGRIVRSYREHAKAYAAAVIDYYSFQ